MSCTTPSSTVREIRIANLTLVIDDDVLRRARIRALEEDTSVNAQVRLFLSRYATGGTGLDAFLAESADVVASSGPEGRTWRREDLHQDGGGHDSDAGGATART